MLALAILHLIHHFEKVVHGVLVIEINMKLLSLKSALAMLLVSRFPRCLLLKVHGFVRWHSNVGILLVFLNDELEVEVGGRSLVLHH